MITDRSFSSPVIGIDPITKGTFVIEWAHVLLDYDEDYELCNTRATGSFIVKNENNPLFDALKEHPLRIQGLVASVIFGVEKKFIKIKQITNYDVIDSQIELSLIFEILDNLEYLEQVIEYKDQNNL